MLRNHDRQQVVQFIQSGAIPGIAAKVALLKDLVVNLRGLCTAFDSAAEAPLWLGDDGQTERSPYIACQNGLLDLRPLLKGKLKPKLMKFTARHFSTVQLGFRYDPDAKCPLWEKTLGEILPATGPGDRRIAVLQEFAGWCLAENGLRLEKFAILVGKGANGKSTVLDTITAVLGSDNVSHLPIEQLGHNFRVGQIKGKLANIVNDLHRVDGFHEGVLKQLVSGDPIQTDRKYKDAETIRPRAKLIFGANSLPGVADRSDGIFRRLLLMQQHHK